MMVNMHIYNINIDKHLCLLTVYSIFYIYTFDKVTNTEYKICYICTLSLLYIVFKQKLFLLRFIIYKEFHIYNICCWYKC